MSVFSRIPRFHNHSGFQAIALFNANQHQEGMLRVQDLAVACPNADIAACHVVQVGIIGCGFMC
jgi:hypothetical protein